MPDAFTKDNGATRVVPGSHRITKSIAKSYAQPLAHHPQEVIVTGPSGGRTDYEWAPVAFGHTQRFGRAAARRAGGRSGAIGTLPHLRGAACKCGLRRNPIDPSAQRPTIGCRKDVPNCHASREAQNARQFGTPLSRALCDKAGGLREIDR